MGVPPPPPPPGLTVTSGHCHMSCDVFWKRQQPESVDTQGILANKSHPLCQSVRQPLGLFKWCWVYRAASGSALVLWEIIVSCHDQSIQGCFVTQDVFPTSGRIWFGRKFTGPVWSRRNANSHPCNRVRLKSEMIEGQDYSLLFYKEVKRPAVYYGKIASKPPRNTRYHHHTRLS